MGFLDLLGLELIQVSMGRQTADQYHVAWVPKGIVAKIDPAEAASQTWQNDVFWLDNDLLLPYADAIAQAIQSGADDWDPDTGAPPSAGSAGGSPSSSTDSSGGQDISNIAQYIAELQAQGIFREGGQDAIRFRNELGKELNRVNPTHVHNGSGFHTN